MQAAQNIITSLWKAEDKSTAYISEKFYRLCKKGYTYAEALQKAKTDFLNDETMSQFHSPDYWSHLIFIGDVQEEKSNHTWIMDNCCVVLFDNSMYYY